MKRDGAMHLPEGRETGNGADHMTFCFTFQFHFQFRNDGFCYENEGKDSVALASRFIGWYLGSINGLTLIA
jgi:hypothetical protein